MPNSRFYTIISLAVLAIIAFSFPSLYQTIQAMRKSATSIEAPVIIFEGTITWETDKKPTLKTEWTGICSTLNFQNKVSGIEQRQFHLGAKLTNLTDKPMKVSSLDCNFSMKGVRLLPIFMDRPRVEGIVLAPGASEEITTTTNVDRDIVVGIADRTFQFSASAGFTEE